MSHYTIHKRSLLLHRYTILCLTLTHILCPSSPSVPSIPLISSLIFVFVVPLIPYLVYISIRNPKHVKLSPLPVVSIPAFLSPYAIIPISVLVPRVHMIRSSGTIRNRCSRLVRDRIGLDPRYILVQKCINSNCTVPKTQYSFLFFFSLQQSPRHPSSSYSRPPFKPCNPYHAREHFDAKYRGFLQEGEYEAAKNVKKKKTHCYIPKKKKKYKMEKKNKKITTRIMLIQYRSLFSLCSVFSRPNMLLISVRRRDTWVNVLLFLLVRQRKNY